MDYSRILDIKTNGIPAKKGSILLSDPFTDCDYFKQSVVLVTNKNEEGTVGFILNKPYGQNVNEILDDYPEFETPAWIGGPVEENHLHYIHTLGKDLVPGSLHVTGRIYWGGQLSVLRDLIVEGKASLKDVRFFIGYSGWAPFQLEHEMKRHSWLVSTLKTKEIMNPELSTWRYVMGLMGDQYKAWVNAPEKAEHN